MQRQYGESLPSSKPEEEFFRNNNIEEAKQRIVFNRWINWCRFLWVECKSCFNVYNESKCYKNTLDPTSFIIVIMVIWEWHKEFKEYSKSYHIGNSVEIQAANVWFVQMLCQLLTKHILVNMRFAVTISNTVDSQMSLFVSL